MRRYRDRGSLVRLLRVLLLATCLSASVGCENPLVVHDCERYGRATIAFENRSSHSIYDAILDGVYIGTIEPGEKIEKDVTAGEHKILFEFPNTETAACSEANPRLGICEYALFWCSKDIN